MGKLRLTSLYNEPDFVIDYKRPDILRMFISERGKIQPQRMTGLRAVDQRKLAREVKRARLLGMLPYTTQGD